MNRATLERLELTMQDLDADVDSPYGGTVVIELGSGAIYEATGYLSDILEVGDGYIRISGSDLDPWRIFDAKAVTSVSIV